jgi:hypothetical protein
MILAYDPSIIRSFIVLATVIMIVNNDRKTFYSTGHWKRTFFLYYLKMIVASYEDFASTHL